MFRVLTSMLILCGVCASVARAEVPTIQTPKPEFSVQQTVQKVVRQPAKRMQIVYRAANVPARDLAEVINHLLRAECKADPASYPEGPTTIVLADQATNSLLISSLPGEREKIEAIIRKLDVAPAMVRIELLLVEMALGRPAGKETDDAPAKGAPLSVGELKAELGLAEPGASAPAEAVNARISALAEAGRLQIVRRPQLVTLDNQAAQLVVGRKEPYVQSTSNASRYGQTNCISYVDVGLELTVTPRISTDGTIFMELDLNDSHLGPVELGVPLAVTKDATIRSPVIANSKVKSVLRIRDGRTIVLGGLGIRGDSKEPEQLVLVTANLVRD